MTASDSNSHADSVVRRRVEDGIGIVTLSDPAHRNALSKRLSDDLAAAVEEVITAGAAVLVLDAEAPVFSSGGSLDGLVDRRHDLSEMYAGYLTLAEATIPTIAAVCGPAIGAGVNLALACDVVLAGESARFDPKFLDVGIHPGGGHLWQLSRRIGKQGAAALVLCGDVLTGSEAAACGLAWRCVPDDELTGLAMRFARRVVGRSPDLIRRTKQTLRQSTGFTEMGPALDLELKAQQWSVEQPYFHTRVREVQDRIARAR
ncbi:MAG: Enoyl-CoA hydratase/isomerase [Nocardia sp.]|uniref:enoyl-CoA hydratase-related protein n=1 Tax=Nocardia sp. TaxID=1821 RepID=UPI0026056140|nr:enoyl-CoA hydratase-related protein [Nocardia sp.]MCU1644366.1 Enoyl-CoA hydratase/isomerase [Nocardia sp.]